MCTLFSKTSAAPSFKKIALKVCKKNPIQKCSEAMGMQMWLRLLTLMLWTGFILSAAHPRVVYNHWIGGLDYCIRY